MSTIIAWIGILFFLWGYNVLKKTNKGIKRFFMISSIILPIIMLSIYSLSYYQDAQKLKENWQRCLDINTINEYKQFKSTQLHKTSLISVLGFSDIFSKYETTYNKSISPLIMEEFNRYLDKVINLTYKEDSLNYSWEITKSTNTINGYLKFIQNYPLSRYTINARTNLWRLIENDTQPIYVKIDIEDQIWPWQSEEELFDYLKKEFGNLNIDIIYTSSLSQDANLFIKLWSTKYMTYVVEGGTEQFYSYVRHCNINVKNNYIEKFHYGNSDTAMFSPYRIDLGEIYPNKIYNFTKADAKNAIPSGNPEKASRPVYFSPYFTVLSLHGKDNYLNNSTIVLETILKIKMDSIEHLDWIASSYYNKYLDQEIGLASLPFLINKFGDSINSGIYNRNDLYYISYLIEKHLVINMATKEISNKLLETLGKYPTSLVF